MTRRYLVTAREVARDPLGVVHTRDLLIHVTAESEVDAVRAALVQGDNGLHLPRGSNVAGVEVGHLRALPEGGKTLGVVGVEECEQESEW